MPSPVSTPIAKAVAQALASTPSTSTKFCERSTSLVHAFATAVIEPGSKSVIVLTIVSSPAPPTMPFACACALSPRSNNVGLVAFNMIFFPLVSDVAVADMLTALVTVSPSSPAFTPMAVEFAVIPKSNELPSLIVNSPSSWNAVAVEVAVISFVSVTVLVSSASPALMVSSPVPALTPTAAASTSTPIPLLGALIWIIPPFIMVISSSPPPE